MNATSYWSIVAHGAASIWLYAALGFVMMVGGFYVLDWTTPGPLRQMVRAGLPNAAGVTAAGLLSQAFVIVLAIYTASGNITEGLVRTLVFGVIGILAQTVCIRVIEWVVGIDVGDLLAFEKFVPGTLVIASAYLGVGLIIAAAIL
ncbi:MAG: DUF350 domain-containing protein [Mycobacterium sp.]